MQPFVNDSDMTIRGSLDRFGTATDMRRQVSEPEKQG